MALHSTDLRWGTLAKLFHWVMALGILGAAAFGFWLSDQPRNPATFKLYALHKSVGITLLGLAVLRLVWRAFDARPLHAPGPGWQRLAATSTHYAIYGLMFAVPLAGWALNSAANFPLQWFGLVNLPAIVPADKVAKELYEELHELGAIALLVLAAIHVAAAWKHHLVDKDNTLKAMIPFGKPDGGSGAAGLLAALLAGALVLAPSGEAVAAQAKAAPAKPAPAAVAAWTTDAARSKLTFTGTQQGEAFTGRFKAYTPKITFAPEALAASSWEVSIDIRSADSANAERDETMRTADWFDVARFPTATFKTVGFRAGTAAGSYIADGDLTIKGKTRRIALPFSWKPAADGKTATLTAQVVLERTQWDLGLGDWLDDAYVGRKVTVGVSLALQR